MKFGKRLAAEASRRWRGSFLDYKAIKRAIQLDVECRGIACTQNRVKRRLLFGLDILQGGCASTADATGRNFDIVLRHELHKVSAFYVDKEEELMV